jgi:hypothetical protein
MIIQEAAGEREIRVRKLRSSTFGGRDYDPEDI